MDSSRTGRSCHGRRGQARGMCGSGPCSSDARCPCAGLLRPLAELSHPFPPSMPPPVHTLPQDHRPTPASLWPAVTPGEHPPHWSTWCPTGWRRTSFPPALPLPLQAAQVSTAWPLTRMVSQQSPTTACLLLSLHAKSGTPSLLPYLLSPSDPVCIEGL